MSITPTNQNKNAISPIGSRKAGIYLWGDSEATWGDAAATWGDVAISPTNQERTPSGAVVIAVGTPIGLLLSITYPATFSIGSGFINQSKS
jgi:hypothetical protein